VNIGACLSDEGAGLSVVYRPIKTTFLTNASRFPKDFFGVGWGRGKFQGVAFCPSGKRTEDEYGALVEWYRQDKTDSLNNTQPTNALTVCHLF